MQGQSCFDGGPDVLRQGKKRSLLPERENRDTWGEGLHLVRAHSSIASSDDDL